MGTRATIRFREFEDEFYVYRGHDGNPGNIMGDLKDVLDKIKGRWSEPNVGLLVTCFLAMMFNPNNRLPNYEIASAFHGDESYRYYVEWDNSKEQWKITCE